MLKKTALALSAIYLLLTIYTNGYNFITGIEEFTVTTLIEWLLVILILTLSTVGCYAHVRSIKIGAAWSWNILAIALAALIVFSVVQVIGSSTSITLLEALSTTILMAAFFTPIFISLLQYARSFAQDASRNS
ncbi:hypothetical protein [Alkalimonas sp.]|uniref:hypothetical protein n=1 Tax=Alkalimonas sp. TaxID=1872453 RepID=UPI00263A5D42|nr:hypothetical protein [Alkalimonas sp.]MCC5826954.1 hypothetical protein [Alkalimonas sp.]